MKKTVFDLKDGEGFVYQGYFYTATSQWRRETSQRYCKSSRFFADGEWHSTTGNTGDWFNQYCEVSLAKVTVELL